MRVDLWAVSGRSFRAIVTEADLLDGETLVQDPPSTFPTDTAAEAETQRALLFALANAAISPLQGAADLDMATDITWPEQPTNSAA